VTTKVGEIMQNYNKDRCDCLYYISIFIYLNCQD